MIEQRLFALLSNSDPAQGKTNGSAFDASGVTALVAGHIYPVILPDGATLPALTYTIISAVAAPTFLTQGSMRYRLQLDCWGKTFGDTILLKDAVIQALSGYTDGSTSIQYLTSQNLFDHELLQFRTVVEFYVMAVSL